MNKRRIQRVVKHVNDQVQFGCKSSTGVPENMVKVINRRTRVFAREKLASGEIFPPYMYSTTVFLNKMSAR